MSSLDPVHPKVWGATVGAGVGGTLSAFVLWILGVTAWHAPAGASGAEDAIASVPGPVAAVVALALSIGLAFLGGWLPKASPEVAAVLDDWQDANDDLEDISGDLNDIDADLDEQDRLQPGSAS